MNTEPFIQTTNTNEMRCMVTEIFDHEIRYDGKTIYTGDVKSKSQAEKYKIVNDYKTRQHEAPQWQPIETLYGSGGEQVLATDGEHIVPIEITSGNAWFAHNITCHIDFEAWFKPTHWMPLPEPPALQQNNKEV